MGAANELAETAFARGTDILRTGFIQCRGVLVEVGVLGRIGE